MWSSRAVILNQKDITFIMTAQTARTAGLQERPSSWMAEGRLHPGSQENVSHKKLNTGVKKKGLQETKNLQALVCVLQRGQTPLPRGTDPFEECKMCLTFNVKRTILEM